MSTFLNASPIFGPVRSRRLGLSLGVNMMPVSYTHLRAHET